MNYYAHFPAKSKPVEFYDLLDKMLQGEKYNRYTHLNDFQSQVKDIYKTDEELKKLIFDFLSALGKVLSLIRIIDFDSDKRLRTLSDFYFTLNLTNVIVKKDIIKYLMSGEYEKEENMHINKIIYLNFGSPYFKELFNELKRIFFIFGFRYKKYSFEQIYTYVVNTIRQDVKKITTYNKYNNISANNGTIRRIIEQENISDNISNIRMLSQDENRYNLDVLKSIQYSKSVKDTLSYWYSTFIVKREKVSKHIFKIYFNYGLKESKRFRHNKKEQIAENLKFFNGNKGGFTINRHSAQIPQCGECGKKVKPIYDLNIHAPYKFKLTTVCQMCLIDIMNLLETEYIQGYSEYRINNVLHISHTNNLRRGTCECCGKPMNSSYVLHSVRNPDIKICKQCLRRMIITISKKLPNNIVNKDIVGNKF